MLVTPNPLLNSRPLHTIPRATPGTLCFAIASGMRSQIPVNSSSTSIAPPSSARAVAKLDAGRFANHLPLTMRFRTIAAQLSESSVAQRQRGQYEQVDGRRSAEPAENNDRHRSFDFTARGAAANRQWQQAKRGNERGHQNWQEPLGSSAHGSIEAPAHALDRDQVFEVRDHHDRVAHGDAE